MFKVGTIDIRNGGLVLRTKGITGPVFHLYGQGATATKFRADVGHLSAEMVGQDVVSLPGGKWAVRHPETACAAKSPSRTEFVRVDPTPSHRRALANQRLEELADDLQAAANAPTGGPTTAEYATRLETLVGAVRAALADFEAPLPKAEGRRACRAGVQWWNNPYPSGSAQAYQWDEGHTEIRKG